MKMSSSECADFDITRLCILVFITIIFLLNVLKLWKKFFGGNSEEDEVELPSSEISDAQKFKDYVLELQDLARKVSDDKTFMSHFGTPDSFPFNDRTLIEVSQKQSSIQDQINSALDEVQRSADERFLATQNTMAEFRTEFLEFRGEVEELMSAREEERSVLQRRHQVEEGTETEDPERCCEHKEVCFMKEICKNENMNVVLLAVKNCMDKVIEESRWNWKKTVLEISEFLAQNYQDIKTHLSESMPEKAESSEQTQLTTFSHIETQTDAIEKQMLDIFLTLDRRVLDFQTVHDALEFFNRKFVHFSKRCHAEWDLHCQRHDIACGRMQEAQDDLDSRTSLMVEVSRCLSSQTPQLGDLLSRLELAVRSVLNDSVGSTPTTLGVVVACAEDTRTAVERIEREFTSKMNHLSKKLTRPGAQLDVLLQTIEDLEVLNDMVKKIARDYTSSTAALSPDPVFPLSDGFGSCPTDSCRDDDTEASFDDGDKDGDESVKDSPSREIISLLDDAISKTKSGLSKKKIIIQKRVIDGASSEDPAGNFAVKDNKMWGSNVSDITLNNSSSEYTFGNSVQSLISEE